MRDASILVLGAALQKGPSGTQLLHLLQEMGPVTVVADTPRQPQEIRRLLEQNEILVLDPVPYVYISHEMFVDTSLRFVTVTTSGFDHIDVRECRQAGILVSSVPGYARQAVAEHTFALLLSLLRKLHLADPLVRSSGFDYRPFLGTEIAGKTFGIIGLGSIGTRVAELALAFGADVIACDIRPRQMAGVALVELRTLLEKSDIVSLHADLNPTSLGLIGKEQLTWMKPTAVFVNTARGRLVDEKALIDALKQKRIVGAALDVLQRERPGEKNPLFDLSNVVLSPHVAFCTEEGLLRRNQTVAENVRSYLQGEPMHLVMEELMKSLPTNR